MNPDTLEQQILQYLNDKEVLKIEDQGCQTIERVFILGVDFLMSQFPNPAINRLMSVVWDVVGQKVAPVCYGIQVPVLSFILGGVKMAPQAMIATPANWVEMVNQDPLTQLGALVYVGSQAVDYANERFLEERPNVLLRAKAYEAEYLETVKSLSPSWKPACTQASTLSEFPKGILTPKAHKVLYSLRPFI